MVGHSTKPINFVCFKSALPHFPIHLIGSMYGILKHRFKMWGPLMWVSVYKWTGMLFRGQLYFSSAAGNLQMQRADLSDNMDF